MLRRNIQTLIWKYDKYVATLVALLPKSAHSASTALGRITLPSIWSVIILSISLISLYFDNMVWAKIGLIVVLSIPIATVLKLIFRRERPKTIFTQNMKIKSYSFPSSHAYSAALAGGYIALTSLAILSSPLGYILASLYVTLIIAIGISRIIVGAHYPTDVTAGWVLGGVVLSIITAMNI